MRFSPFSPKYGLTRKKWGEKCLNLAQKSTIILSVSPLYCSVDLCHVTKDFQRHCERNPLLPDLVFCDICQRELNLCNILFMIIGQLNTCKNACSFHNYIKLKDLQRRERGNQRDAVIARGTTCAEKIKPQ